MAKDGLNEKYPSPEECPVHDVLALQFGLAIFPVHKGNGHFLDDRTILPSNEQSLNNKFNPF